MVSCEWKDVVGINAQGLAARYFGGQSAVEPGVARTKTDGRFFAGSPKSINN